MEFDIFEDVENDVESNEEKLEDGETVTEDKPSQDDGGNDEPKVKDKTADDKSKADWIKEKQALELKIANEEKNKASYESKVAKVMEKLGYKGKNLDDVLLAVESQETGVDLESLKAQKINSQKAVDEAIKNHPDVINAQQIIENNQRQRAKDAIDNALKEIRKEVPSIKSKDLMDVLEPFVQIMKTGLFTEAEAYQKCISKKEAKTEPPKSTGSTAGGGGAKRNTFTKDEVDRMSKAEIKKNYDAVIASQSKW